MGKKSKKNAANPNASVSNASGGVGGGGIQGETGLVATSGSKKLKCVRCFCNLKDLAKAHQCPGCSLLYCWRCEKKAFLECPNGKLCLSPMRRCNACIEGNTSASALIEAGLEFYAEEVQSLKESTKPLRAEIDARVVKAVEQNERLSLSALPFLCCGGNDCDYWECYQCAKDPWKGKISSCTKCKTNRCTHCLNRELDEYQAGGLSNGVFEDFVERKIGLIDYAEFLRRSIPNTMVHCSSCEEALCFNCMSEIEMASAALAGLYADGINGESKKPAMCSHCYWASKSCTNPNCPNEAGVPTKRCGGCHLDRYCSVECQAAAYPEHMERCQKIQVKRESAGLNQMGHACDIGDVDYVIKKKEDAFLQYLAQKYM